MSQRNALQSARRSCPAAGRIASWNLNESGQPVEWTPKGQIQISDDILGVISLAASGAGICQTYDFIARPLMANGQLREILAHTRGRTRSFSLIYAPHKGLSSASETLIRFMQQATMT